MDRAVAKLHNEEQLTSGDSIYIRAHTGKRVGIARRHVQARWNDFGAFQRFVIEKENAGLIYQGDEIYLKAATGNHVDVENNIVRARWNDRGSYQRFVIETDGVGPVCLGDTVYLKAHTGKHLDVEGNSVQARWNDKGEYQKLVLEKDTPQFKRARIARMIGIDATLGRRWDIAEMRCVGNSSLLVPILSLGCAPLGELCDDILPEEALRAVQEAHALGFRHFDTAPWYGNGMSEARVGMGLNSVAKEGGAFTISTKVGRTLDPAPRKNDGAWDGPWQGGCDLCVRYDYSYDAVMQQHRESCLRMGLPRVDALAIHDLDAMFGGRKCVQRYLAQLRPPGGLKAMQELRERGSIQAIGIGCNPYRFGSREVCIEVADMGNLDYIILAGPYNLLNQEALDDLLPLCREKDMSVLLGAPFASGILATGSKSETTGKYMYEPASADIIAKVAKIEEVCDKHAVTLPAAALQFPLFHPRVASVLCGVKSAAEVSVAVSSLRTQIPAAFWHELKATGLLRADAPIHGEDTQHL